MEFQGDAVEIMGPVAKGLTKSVDGKPTTPYRAFDGRSGKEMFRVTVFDPAIIEELDRLKVQPGFVLYIGGTYRRKTEKQPDGTYKSMQFVNCTDLSVRYKGTDTEDPFRKQFLKVARKNRVSFKGTVKADKAGVVVKTGQTKGDKPSPYRLLQVQEKGNGRWWCSCFDETALEVDALSLQDGDEVSVVGIRKTQADGDVFIKVLGIAKGEDVTHVAVSRSDSVPAKTTPPAVEAAAKAESWSEPNESEEDIPASIFMSSLDGTSFG